MRNTIAYIPGENTANRAMYLYGLSRLVHMAESQSCSLSICSSVYTKAGIAYVNRLQYIALRVIVQPSGSFLYFL